MNADGNKVTLILVGTKADRLFENGLPQEEELNDDLGGIQEESKEEVVELLDRLPDMTLADSAKFEKSEISAPKADSQLIDSSLSPLLEHSDINRVASHFAKQNGFASYWRTSSLFSENTKNVFDEAIYCTYENRLTKQKKIDESVEESHKEKRHNTARTTSVAAEWMQNHTREIKREKCTIF